MNFNTSNNTFRQLLGNGLIYRVPPFQRDYSWTEDEWDDLWQDITALYEDEGEPAHYMGYLVLQSSDNKRFDIIDGQQRITTISVMILAGLSYLKDLIAYDLDAENNQRRKEQFQNSYIGYVDPVSLIPRAKLELNRHNNKFYQTYLVPLEVLPQRNLNASEHQLRKAFHWFKERISQRFERTTDSGQQFAAMLDSLVDKLFFTVITVTDELNAFKVFETLNARGVRLSATDLLKNYLFSVISSGELHDIEIRALEDRWERIVGLLGSESFPEFLRIYWNSRHRLVRKSDLFKTIRRHVTTREEAFSLVRELDYSAEVYAVLRDPMHRDWHLEEREALQQLLMFNVRQPLAMLMTCYRHFYEHQRENFRRILRAISVVSLRYNVICGLPSHEQERVYNSIARKLTIGEHTDIHAVFSALQEVYPKDPVFKAAFTTKTLKTTNSRNKKVVRYILFALEKQRSGQCFDFESSRYNLEHILPEHPSEDWNYMDETQQDRCIYRLGNMTPLEADTNRDLGNGSFQSKITAYRESQFQITRSVAEKYTSWDESKIEARQRSMADLAVTIWKIQ
ncbi:DUF262 domain-containing protein [Orrella sp. 11846]|uniref:DUF262 domain-containing protein n=1 Tax=Orrella sp. 11846 TaxID=3409913 RepID=UPI003B5CA44A